MTGDRVFVFIDYQNLYHRARASFPGVADLAVQGGHVHPIKVGELLCRLGQSKNPNRFLANLRIYRAMPGRRSGPKLERATKIQVARWETHPKIKVRTRPMAYINDARSGKPRWIGREKGIDVMLAIDLLYLAYTNAYDTAIVFSADTDLVPAMEAVVRMGKRVETATWNGHGENCGPLRITNLNIWNHYLDESLYKLVRDDTDYLKTPE